MNGYVVCGIKASVKRIDELVERDVPLAPRTTFLVGGKADYFVTAREESTFHEALAWAASRDLPVAVFGGGSNLLVHDRGFMGLVLHVANQGIERVQETKDKVLVRVAAGELLDAFVECCVRAGWAGVECLSGIPGTVGASPVQNVGAYGQEIADCLVEVIALDRTTLSECRFRRSECGFTYRNSVFKQEERDRYVVCSVVFELDPTGVPTVQYPELARRIADRGIAAPSLQDVRDVVLATRRSKSMLADPSDPNARSAGSFFVNPIVSLEQARQIEEYALGSSADARTAPVMPRFPAEGGVKLSAAWLVERAGFPKGAVEGQVGLSARHALAIINRGGASAAEVVRFAAKIRAAVRERFGVVLHPEPVLIGFPRDELSVLG